MNDTTPLLAVDDLRTSFATPAGVVRAVGGVSLSIEAGETLGIVGESGSGKSVLVRTIMGLVDQEATASVTGSVRFRGDELRAMPLRQRRQLWGRHIAMVFQNPMTSLNPVKTIGAHLGEHLRLHLDMGRRDSRARSVELLGEVGISTPARMLDRYPHELSGGMRQRVCIALALACRPALLIADEPTTALDVTVQQQILDLLDRVTAETNMATILITHDLAVVNRHAERVVVMYGGRVAEHADVRTLYRERLHPYSAALMRAAPRLSDPPHTRLATIEGRPPDLSHLGPGCAFAPRCPLASALCVDEAPPLRVAGSGGHTVACHHAAVASPPSAASSSGSRAPQASISDAGSSSDVGSSSGAGASSGPALGSCSSHVASLPSRGGA